MRRVVIESPYRGKTQAETDTYLEYLRAVFRDCYKRGESAIASHAVWPQAFGTDHQDDVAAEKQHGLKAGHAWISAADALVVYHDYGVTPGMVEGIQSAAKLKHRVAIEFRTIEGWSEAKKGAQRDRPIQYAEIAGDFDANGLRREAAPPKPAPYRWPLFGVTRVNKIIQDGETWVWKQGKYRPGWFRLGSDEV